MFCSGCGQALAPGQAFCSQCGHPAESQAPCRPGPQYQLESYAGKVRALSILWFIYTGLSLLLGIAGLIFFQAIFSGFFIPLMHDSGAGGSMPEWLFPAIIRVALITLAAKSALALLAGWGLWKCTEWGRIVAIVAAVLSLLKVPLGTALGIWTMTVLLDSQNTMLYKQLRSSSSGH